MRMNEGCVWFFCKKPARHGDWDNVNGAYEICLHIIKGKEKGIQTNNRGLIGVHTQSVTLKTDRQTGPHLIPIPI